MIPITALFVRSDSIYKSLPGVDCFDIDRDARTWSGGTPVVAHPPCRAWGQFAMFANPREGEKDLALWAIEQVQKWGGVLEHPYNSSLWKVVSGGGWMLPIHQHWFGHRAEKKTKLYIVGCEPTGIPEMPLSLDYPTHVIGDSGRVALGNKRPEVSKAEREHTPPLLAEWLVELARRCA